MMNTPFTRRQVIVAGAAGAAAISLGTLAVARPWVGSTHSAAVSMGTGSASSSERILVLVTMYGGNDGLNTVVPAGDPAYQAGRPTLGYQPHEVLELTDGLGLNPKLTNLAQLWKQGHLAVVQGVGYPDPNLSHFDSMDIWQTANPQSGTGPGWLGPWLDAGTGDPLQAVSIGATVPTALRGAKYTAVALESVPLTLPGPLVQQQAYTSLAAPGPDRLGLMGVCAGCGADLLAAKRELDQLSLSSSGGSDSPQGTAASLSDQLALVAALIGAGAPARVYQVSLSTFDTHADEKVAHEEKLAELDAGIGAFFSALQGSPRGADTVLMTYSEFGRRVTQNASGGTDHGTAAPLFVVGPAVKGGVLYGEQPSLSKLDSDGNLVYNVDFRSVYATMLSEVLDADPTQALGAKFPTLAFL